MQRWIRQIPHNREEQREVGCLRLGAGRNEADEQQLQCTHCDGHRRWSQGSESSTDSSVQACVGETDRGTGSGKGKYEMMWVAFLEVLGKRA